MKRCLAVVTLVFCSAMVSAQEPTPGANLIVGTWKQNMAKSTYKPGGPPPFSSVRQYAAGNEGAIVAITMNVNSDGLPSLGAVSAARYDGKEYVQHTLATLAASLSTHVAPAVERTVTYKAIDSYTVEIVQKQDGEVVSVSTRSLSRDGKTMTERFTKSQGQDVANVLVFDKQ